MPSFGLPDHRRQIHSTPCKAIPVGALFCQDEELIRELVPVRVVSTLSVRAGGQSSFPWLSTLHARLLRRLLVGSHVFGCIGRLLNDPPLPVCVCALRDFFFSPRLRERNVARQCQLQCRRTPSHLDLACGTVPLTRAGFPRTTGSIDCVRVRSARTHV